MAEKAPGLTCSIDEFADIAEIKLHQAQVVCAGRYPPPLIVVGRETRVIRARIPEWLDQEAERQLKERLGAEAFGDAATEPTKQPHMRLYEEG